MKVIGYLLLVPGADRPYFAHTPPEPGFHELHPGSKFFSFSLEVPGFAEEDGKIVGEATPIPYQDPFDPYESGETKVSQKDGTPEEDIERKLEETIQQLKKQPRLIRNRVMCLKCKDIIESKHRHDFVWCACRAIFTDGGTSYMHRGGACDLMEDMSEFEDR